MPGHVELSTPVEKQLLIQLGERIRRARLAQQVSAVDLAKRLGMSRSTLHAAESGVPSVTIGTYVRVLGALGFSADLALVGTGESVQLLDAHRSAPDLPRHSHIPQDLQGLLMHREAVRLIRAAPGLAERAKSTLARWRDSGDERTRPLWDEWVRILDQRNWKLALQETERGAQLRQASPLTTLLPQDVRMSILRKGRAMQGGVQHAG